MSVKPIAALTLTCLVWGILLGVVYRITRPRIEEAERMEMEKKLQEIFPACRFEKENGYFSAILDNQIVGKVVLVSTKGYGGEMKVLVGVNLDGTVKGVRILSHNETRGIGSKIQEQGFLSQFEGKRLDQLYFSPEGEIEAITGATISSRAVLTAVREALEHV